MDIDKYLQELRSQLLNKSNWRKIILNREWVNAISKEAGVYVFRETKR